MPAFFIFVFWRDILEGREEAILSFEAYEFVCDLESLLQALENERWWWSVLVSYILIRVPPFFSSSLLDFHSKTHRVITKMHNRFITIVFEPSSFVK